MKLSAGNNWVMHVVIRVTTSVNFNRMILMFWSDLSIMSIFWMYSSFNQTSLSDFDGWFLEGGGIFQGKRESSSGEIKIYTI